MHERKYQRCVDQQSRRLEKDCFAKQHENYECIYRISQVMIRTGHYQLFRRVERRWRALANEREIPRTPRINSYSNENQQDAEESEL